MRITRSLIVLALLLAPGFGIGCRKAAPPPPPLPTVGVHKVGEATVGGAQQRYAATVAPYTQTSLYFENSAYIRDILHVPRDGRSQLVDKGDVLPAGSVLATQDTSELDAQVAQAAANLKSAKAAISEAEAKLAQAQAASQQAYAGLRSAEENYNTAVDKLAEARAVRQQAVATLAKGEATQAEYRKAFERASVLYPQGAMTKPDYDRAVANFEVGVSNVAGARAQIRQATADIAAAASQARAAQAAIKSAQAQVRSADAQIAAAAGQIEASRANAEAAAANLEKARVKLSHCTLVTPTDSVVVSRSVEPGALVGPTREAFTVADTRRMKVVFGVPDLDVDQLKVGQQVKVALDALGPGELKGRVVNIAPSADPKGRTFDVTVMIDNADRRLKNGMIATTRLTRRGPQKRVVLVPLSALVRSPRNMDAYAVIVVAEEGGKLLAHYREVTLGRAVSNMTEVEQGVKPGELVVVAGNNLLPDGSAVQVEK